MEKLQNNLKNFNIKKQEGKIVLIFVGALLFYVAFILFSDIKKIEKISLGFSWNLLFLLLILTLSNYFFRALRFYLYLRKINIHISFKEAIGIFLSGLSMTVTPGKSGEIVKAYLLKRTHDTSISHILPLLIMERMTDGIAMIILGLGGVFLLKNSTLFFALSVVFVIAAVTFIKSKKLILPIISKLENKFPHFKLFQFFDMFFTSSQALFTIPNLTLGIGIGCIAWAFEGLALLLIITQFTHTDIVHGLSTALFIFSFSSIAGFFVLIPGGIGVAEGSITYFLTLFFSLSLPIAVFITLLFRFVTLWFGVFLGLTSLILNLRKKTD